MKWAAVKSCPVYGGDVKRFDFDAIRTLPGVRAAVQFPIPDPALTRGRVFSGGVAVVADTWYQAKTALDRMPIEWEIPPANAAFNSANMREALVAALDRPGQVRADHGDVEAGFARAARSWRHYSTPFLPRARMEPAMPPCWSATIASISGSATRARRKPGSAPPRSPEFPRPMSTCTCATWVAGSAGTVTAPRPSTRS